ncbi:MAG TPA: addiction module protein [Pyrinomonadaceae bacterium]|nr:addiction module protein [Pyrinomonadaceae bacterium]
MSHILEEALKLPEAERLKLADDLYESVERSKNEVYLTPEQEAELARRLEDYEKNPGGNFSWEEIEAEALSR